VSRVLLVDDDPVILRLLEVNFRLEGFETATASRGDLVLDAARASAPDAIVLDLMLPGLDGYEVLERLRADASLASVPVVLLTARAMEEDRLRAASAQVDYLSKPFDPEELVSLVRDRIGAAP
jgi:two-component system OmpR family response regulator